MRPDEFRPERFLEEEKSVEAHGNDFRFVPFGVGRRSCPGIILALPIIGITLGSLVQNFQRMRALMGETLRAAAPSGRQDDQRMSSQMLVSVWISWLWCFLSFPGSCTIRMFCPGCFD